MGSVLLGFYWDHLCSMNHVCLCFQEFYPLSDQQTRPACDLLLVPALCSDVHRPVDAFQHRGFAMATTIVVVAKMKSVAVRIMSSCFGRVLSFTTGA